MQNAEKILSGLLFVLNNTKHSLIRNKEIDKEEALDIFLHHIFSVIDGVNGQFPHPIDLVVRKSTEEDIADYKEQGEENEIIHEDLVLNESVYLHQLK